MNTRILLLLLFFYWSNSDSLAVEREHSINCLAQNIYMEAHADSVIDQIAVAQVTVNRARHRNFPRSICAVVYQKQKIKGKLRCEFSWVCRPPRGIAAQHYDRVKQIAILVYDGKLRIPALNSALFFHSAAIKPRWPRKKVGNFGHHVFYR